MIRRPPRSTPLYSSAASDVYKRQLRLLAILAGQLDQIPVGKFPVDLAEIKILVERLAGGAERRVDPRGQWSGQRSHARNDRNGRYEILALIREEEMQHVLD